MPRTRLAAAANTKPLEVLDVEVKPLVVTSVALNNMLQEYLECSQTQTAAEARKKELGKQIVGRYHDKHQAKRIEALDFFSTRTKNTHTHVDAAKLIQAGVAPSLIAECTVETVSYYPRITAKAKPAAVPARKRR